MNQFVRSLALTVLALFPLTLLHGQMTKVQVTWPMAFDTNWVQVNVPYAFKYYREFKPFANGKPGGYLRDYYQNGALQMEGTLSEAIEPGTEAELKRQGICVWYYPNGKVQTIASFSNNLLNGRRTAYFLNGNKSEDGDFKDGKANGKHGTYYESGKPKTLGDYEQGILLGSLLNEWDANGKKSVCYVERFAFLNTNYGYKTGDFGTYSVSFSPNVGFGISNKKEQFIAFKLDKPSSLTGVPYSFECTIASGGGNNAVEYGFAYEYSDLDNYKFFMIKDQSVFSVGEVKAGVTTYEINSGYTKALKIAKTFGAFVYDNINTIAIALQDGKLIFTVNGEVVHTNTKGYDSQKPYGLLLGPGIFSATYKSFVFKAYE
jgi:antitoxin component YwqK of YwqJK toxin-antitoxin module